jgi:hypothetical protein
MNNDSTSKQSAAPQPKFGWLKILGIIVVATIISTAVAVWAVSYYFFPKEFKPVTLSVKEEQVLDEKLERLDAFQKPQILRQKQVSPPPAIDAPLEPERYREDDAAREIVLSEKELNALLAKNTDLARKLAIDLSDDMASAKLLIPLDEDFPFLGGQTLKVAGGMALAYRDGKPIVALSGISIWGVPLPNAWLGNIKNVDLVKEFGDKDGFWSAFAAGVEDIKIDEGSLRIKLKE